MRTFLTYVLMALVSGLSLHAQECDIRLDGPAIEAFKGITVGTTIVSTLTITNNSKAVVTIDSVVAVNAQLYNTVSLEQISDKGTRISPGAWMSTHVVLKIRHNMPISCWLVVYLQCTCGATTRMYHITGWATAEGFEYTDNFEYTTLYDSLRAHVVNHTSLGYKAGREMMFGKADNVNDSVECIYTGKKLKTAGIPPNGEFNTEHTWVQSRGSSVEPNKSDVYHLYPTNPNANSIRANYPFGVISKVWKDAGGGSQLGFTAAGDTVFEPRDVSKGNIARSIFYYLIRYGNLTGYYTSPYNMDETLRQWNEQDPPDARERARCDTIAAYQGKRNPFVFRPQLVERLDFVPTTHTNVLRVLQRMESFNPDNDNTVWNREIVNRGPDTLVISDVRISDPEYLSVAMHDDTRILPHQTKTLTFSYIRAHSAVPSRMVATIVASDSSRDSVVFVQCAAVAVHDASANPIADVRPQPMTDFTDVYLASAGTNIGWVRLYSMRGDCIADLHESMRQEGDRIVCRLVKADISSNDRVLMLRAIVNGTVVSRTIVR